MSKSIKYVAVDFDGTCVEHAYPKIGRNIGAGPVLREIQDNGIKIILNTMRCDEELQEAVDWFETEDIDLYGVNENPSQKSWTTSPKVHADVDIDDRNLGCPLHNGYVDWIAVLKVFVQNGWIVLDRDTIKDIVNEIKEERS